MRYSIIKHSKLTQNIGKILTGAAIGHLITFLATPILARLYSPENFGLQSSLLALTSPILTLTSMAFPVAIVVARNDANAVALARLALFGALAISPIVAIVFYLKDGWLLHILSLSELKPYIPLIPVLVLALTLNSSASHQIVRKQAFGLMSRASITTAAVSSLAKIIMGLSNLGLLGLIFGNLLGYLMMPLMARRLLRTQSHTHPLNLSHLKAVASEHRDFPLFRAPQNFVWALAQSIPIIFLTSGFGATTAGYYSVALALAGAPIMLFGNSAQSVLYPHLTRAVEAGTSISRLMLQATAALLAIGLTLLFPILVFGPAIFEMILGPTWREAGFYAALLTPWLLFNLGISPSLAAVPALKLQRALLVYEILSAGLKTFSMAAGIFLLGTEAGTLLLFSLSGAIAYIALILWVLLIVRKKEKSVAS